MKKSVKTILKGTHLLIFLIIFLPVNMFAQQTDTSNQFATNQYIVVLNNQLAEGVDKSARRQYVESAAVRIKNQYNVTVTRTFSQVMLGLVVIANQNTIEDIKNDPQVQTVEAEQKFYMNASAK